MPTTLMDWADTSASAIGAETAGGAGVPDLELVGSAKVLATPAYGLGTGCHEGRGNLCTGSCPRASVTVTPNTDSPRIPHDKMAKMTDSCHEALPEGHCRRRARSFKFSLNFSCECASDEDK
jgi:hypothetical protein